MILYRKPIHSGWWQDSWSSQSLQNSANNFWTSSLSQALPPTTSREVESHQNPSILLTFRDHSQFTQVPTLILSLNFHGHWEPWHTSCYDLVRAVVSASSSQYPVLCYVPDARPRFFPGWPHSTSPQEVSYIRMNKIISLSWFRNWNYTCKISLYLVNDDLMPCRSQN